MANCSAGEFSQLPWISDLFHSFTHVNFYFDNVSSVFVPTLPDYQQVREYYFFYYAYLGHNVAAVRLNCISLIFYA